MKSILRNFTRALLCLAAGAAVYYVFEAQRSGPGDRLASDRPGAPQPTPLDSVTGAQLLAAAQLAIDQPASLVAEVELSGAISDQGVSLTGQYQQQGRGEARRFCWTLRGRVGRGALRLWQVTAQDILWTDLAWDADGAKPRRSVERVDLARLRTEVAPSGNLENIDPGQARAAFARPELWPAQGGLPALLVAIDQAFSFGAPALMRMRDRPVYALIGRSAPATEGAAPEGASAAPDHVLLVVDAALRIPVLVEFRAPDDPLADSALSDSQRLVESPHPLMKLRLLNPRPDGQVDPERFSYSPPADVAWVDRTEARLRNLRQAAGLTAAADGMPPAVSLTR